ncbi:hypothetical protein GQ44DRAFT_614849 [Phaeosphaeriaceae sp. PMI808]|nr:hypothetical protein GQ44DRAFT_614849 [Phaeosphaeriaceae sp. PMI808]
MPRLGHKKSKLGCRQCKTRHVKCDELKPCSNCVRHGVPCSLVTWGHAHHPPSESATSSSDNAAKHVKQTLDEPMILQKTSTPLPSLHIDYVLNPPKIDSTSVSVMSEDSSPSSQSDHPAFLTQFIHNNERNQADIWVRDLELMHHWSTEAYGSLSQRDDIQYVWKILAPQHAVTHTYLMHELLAFAAQHKAHKHPDQRLQYYTFGVHHQDLTIRAMRKIIQNITEHEAVAIVATSTLLTLSIFASTGFELSHPEIPSSTDPIDGILNIFSLMQGITDVIALAQQLVTNSFLGPLFRDAKDPTPSQPMLFDLKCQLPALLLFIESQNLLPEPEREVYLGAVRLFEPILQMTTQACTDNREMRFLFAWPLRVLPEFTVYLRQRRSGAVTVLMYYSSILFVAQRRYWFLDNWGELLIQACSQELEQDWLPIVQWPLSFINHTSLLSFTNDFIKTRHGISLDSTLQSGSISGAPQRKPMEAPYRQCDPAPAHPFTTVNRTNFSPYSGLATRPTEMHDQKANVPTYAGQSRSTEGAE